MAYSEWAGQITGAPCLMHIKQISNLTLGACLGARCFSEGAESASRLDGSPSSVGCGYNFEVLPLFKSKSAFAHSWNLCCSRYGFAFNLRRIPFCMVSPELSIIKLRIPFAYIDLRSRMIFSHRRPARRDVYLKKWPQSHAELFGISVAKNIVFDIY